MPPLVIALTCALAVTARADHPPACASDSSCQAAATALLQDMAPFVPTLKYDPSTNAQVEVRPAAQTASSGQAQALIQRYRDISSAWRSIDPQASGLAQFQRKAEPEIVHSLSGAACPIGSQCSAPSSQAASDSKPSSPPGTGAPPGAPLLPAGVTQAPPDPRLIQSAQEQERQLQASGLSPRRADPLVADYLKGGSPQDAVRLASEVLGANPDDAQALSLRAQARLESGDGDGAYADARRALALNPEDPVARVLVGHRDELSAAAGRVNARPGFGQSVAEDAASLDAEGIRGAELPFSAAHGARAASPVLATESATLAGAALEHFQEARDALAIGDAARALLEATAAIDAAPQKAAGYVLRAAISNRVGNFTAALKDARRALALDPSNVAALRELAYAEVKTGQFQEAFEHADQAVRLDPSSGPAYLYRAMAEEGLGRTAEALADYAKAEQLEPALAPVADAAVARLRGRAPTAGVPAATQRLVFRGGTIALSMLLIVLGLAGTATGRRALTTARGLWRRTPPETGELLAGNYRLVRELGRGGMGVVYEAVDEALRRPVAVKRLQREAGLGAEELGLLLQEARIVAQLKHPRIAEIYNVLVDGDLFLVFEYLDGQPLDRALAQRGRFSAEDAARVVEDVAAAVDYAHGQNVIHRDLKPSNVMRERSGGCKVLDFGIARQSRKATALTVTAASGTPDYMSPEQLMGSVSKASDLYALGVMAYELLAGRRPFPGPDFLAQKLRRRFEPLDPLILPPSLGPFFARALDPEPAGRPKSGADFVAQFKEALGALLHS